MEHATTLLYGLDGLRVVSVSLVDDGVREVVVVGVAGEQGCPSCGVISRAVHAEKIRRIKDLLRHGVQGLRLLWQQRRWACKEALCPRKTFAKDVRADRAAAQVDVAAAPGVAAVRDGLDARGQRGGPRERGVVVVGERRAGRGGGRPDGASAGGDAVAGGRRDPCQVGAVAARELKPLCRAPPPRTTPSPRVSRTWRPPWPRAAPPRAIHIQL